MSFQFENMSDFFNMGGYAVYVWASFIGTFICMLCILFQSVYVSKKIKHSVQKEAARAERIMAARAARKKKQQDKAQSASSAVDMSNTVTINEDSNEPKT